MHLRCGGIFSNHVIAKFYTECASKRIVKISLYLAKIWTVTKWDVFLETQCIYSLMYTAF